MRYWRVERKSSEGQLDLGRAFDLMSAIGHEDVNAMAGAILKTVASAAPIVQCTIFAYEFGNRPRTVAVADRRGGRFLQDIADSYARHYYALDGNQSVIAPASSRQDCAIVLHQQASDEIAHAGYRAACYQRPNVSDRLSLLVQPAGDIWLSVNFYRDSAQGQFGPGEIAAIETLAPLFAHGAQHHYRLNGQPLQGAGPMMLASLRRHCPDLSKRELDVLRGVLEGLTAVEIADAMGLQPSSVITYQKRAYKRMGISSQRQLFALCLGPQAA
ncbi:helix-turn-helix transcriptional regulator [Janthinobacterium psychrotolerans]|uniref:DNA-binding transcriptional regulator, CsgD family n=1 Tax=Janthinobacterium psychrotolerans TaxID=1747903 RepID=A0A1A7BZE3_9BURK|nr:helix-turn-helix transcriptional regulator [Janthinobacterium psychrotolerans]OBV38867.1 DNA-binding transcriptional regulator, CsgD family [Janthinobacterium psychrotolerans]